MWVTRAADRTGRVEGNAFTSCLERALNRLKHTHTHTHTHTQTRYISLSNSLHSNYIQPGGSVRTQNHISCTFSWIKHFLCLAGSRLLSSTSLSNLPASLTVNCSVLLHSVALASSQTLAPRRLYHKGQKEEETLVLCVCVCGVCVWVGGIGRERVFCVCVCSFEREVV